MERNTYSTYNNIGYSKVNLSELVVSHVKHKILTGELKSGDRLVEADISEELQISRAPVREAIRELNMQGLLSFSPRRGSQILDLSYQDIREIFSIRIPLEQQVLTIIFENEMLTEEDLKHLEMLNQEMLEMDRETADPWERIYLLNSKDLEFHKYFWHKSESYRREHILENQFFQLLIAMNQDVTTLGSIREKYDEHQQIIESCRSGSLAETLAAFDHHMSSYLEVITKL